jgi:HTH-type transcriptional regulator / antitoxin HigA
MRHTTKTTGKKIVRFNAENYAKLLTSVLPTVIENEEQNKRLLRVAEKMIVKGSKRTQEESALLKLLVYLIRGYEQKMYQPEMATPHEALVELMSVRDLKQVDLLPIFKSKGITSEVVNGKRGISKIQAKALAEFFNVSTEVFL